jgi:hypothetical protein
MHTSIMWHFVVACKRCNLTNYVCGDCKHPGSHRKQEVINPFIFSICAVEYVSVGLDWAGGVLWLDVIGIDLCFEILFWAFGGTICCPDTLVPVPKFLYVTRKRARQKFQFWSIDFVGQVICSD